MYDLIGRAITQKFFNHPVFIVGVGRSGTSILLKALGNHSRLLAADRESPFIPYVGALLHPFEFRYNKDYHLESLATSLDYFYKQFRKLCFESVWGSHYGLKNLVVRNRLLLKSLTTAQYWCAKTFPNQIEAQGLARLYPSVKFLYIYRSGCDVVFSRMKFKGMSHMSFEQHCRIWADSVEKYRYFEDMEQAIRVRQEDILDQPEKIYRQILGFIGVGYEEGPLKFSQTTLIHSLDQRTKTNVDVSKALSERPKPYLSWDDEQKRLFIEICGKGMHTLGYEIPF